MNLYLKKVMMMKIKKKLMKNLTSHLISEKVIITEEVQIHLLELDLVKKV